MLIKNIFFITFGCKVNRCETESFMELFQNAGFAVAPSEHQADLFVINSCTVTGEADKKLRQEINRLRKKFSHVPIALSGCFVQAFPREAQSLDVDILTGTKNKQQLISMVSQFFTQKNNPITDIIPYQKDDPFLIMPVGQQKNQLSGTRGFLKIQDGCTQCCTYCIIPKARGPLRSMPLSEIKSQTAALSIAGHQEIVLVGIHLSAYGKNFNTSLKDAVLAVWEAGQPLGLKRVRLGSLEPEQLTAQDLQALKNIPSFCPHFHISLQSGCEKTLREMNRPYTTTQFEQLISNIRHIFNDTDVDVAVTTDIMTGFPGETDDDFNQSLEFVRKIGFADAHVFPYSIRPGTVAASRLDQIPKSLSKQRAAIMREVSTQNKQRFIHSMLGSKVEVLFERESTLEPDFYKGHAANYTVIKVKKLPHQKSLQNNIKCVTIVDKDTDNTLIGEFSSAL